MHQIPSTIINEPFETLSLESLELYLKRLNTEIDELMKLHSIVASDERNRISERAVRCYNMYEKLYGYYLPLYNEWKLNIVRQQIRESAVFEKYRRLGIIR